MSWAGFGRGVLHVLGTVSADAQPLSNLIAMIPGWGPIAVTALKAMSAADTILTNGPDKRAAVVQMVLLAHPGLDPAEVGKYVDQVIAKTNELDSLIAQVPQKKP